MKVSLSWLKNYIEIKMDADSLAQSLTMSGLEVETVSDRFEYLNTVLVGKIVEINPHPNADKLKICKVDIGRIISVVCGASNIYNEMFVPVAMPDTHFPDGSAIEKTVVRGIQSEGMLCSEAELGIGADKSGIMELDQSFSIGDKLTDALKLSDMVFEIDLTPNRPDCLGIIGIAREISALQNNFVKYPNSSLSDSNNEIANHVSVIVKNPELCPRYSARLIMDIKVAPSPFWLQDKLTSVGLKPINNIVDITNFVMMETGQPLHAFDFDRFENNEIVVRSANDGETFTTLDGKNRILSNDMLLICDGEKPTAIAGVMGGINSEINEATTKVFIESAYFNPACIRKTAKILNLGTDASHRFERGTDPNGIITALNRAVLLMVEIGNGKLIDGMIDNYPNPIKKTPIILSAQHTNRILGTNLTNNEIEKILKSIEFKTEKQENGKLSVTPPSFRVDISRPIDVIEEVARLSGYDNIPISYKTSSGIEKHAKPFYAKNKMRRLMTGFGFDEIINYSFMNKQACDWLNFSANDVKRNCVDILNPLTEDQSVMRTSLISGLLETMRRNISQQNKSLKLFEIGRIYLSVDKNKQPEEIEMLAGVWAGTRFDISWHCKEIDCDFYDIKGVVEGLLSNLNIKNIVFTSLPSALCAYTRQGYTAQILAGNKNIGLVGELNSTVVRNYNLPHTAFIFELNLQCLFDIMPSVKIAKPLPKFPAVFRDITVIVDKTLESDKILRSIKNCDEKLMENLYLSAVFEGKPISNDKKSLSFRLTYRSPDKTLEDDKINYINKIITDKIVKEFGANLPC